MSPTLQNYQFAILYFRFFQKKNTLHSKQSGPFIHVMLERTHDQWVTEERGGEVSLDERRVQRGAGTVEM